MGIFLDWVAFIEHSAVFTWEDFCPLYQLRDAGYTLVLLPFHTQQISFFFFLQKVRTTDTPNPKERTKVKMVRCGWLGPEPWPSCSPRAVAETLTLAPGFRTSQRRVQEASNTRGTVHFQSWWWDGASAINSVDAGHRWEWKNSCGGKQRASQVTPVPSLPHHQSFNKTRTSGGGPSTPLETDHCEQSESREAVFWLRDPHALHLALLFFQMVVMITIWCILSRFSLAQLFSTLWTVACQTPLSMGFSRQEYWGGLPCPPPEDLPDPGTEPASLMSPALAGRFLPLAPPGKPTPGRVLY